jgi:hypothetical protein
MRASKSLAAADISDSKSDETNETHRHPIGVLAKAEKKVVGMAL